MTIDWNQDYQGEFICPECQAQGMRVRQLWKNTKKRRFYCPHCRHLCIESCDINIKAIEDILNPGIIWYTNHRYKEFTCPTCQAHNIYYQGIRHGKKAFVCRTCKIVEKDSLDLSKQIFSRYSGVELSVRPFCFNDDQWDLRAINSNFDSQDISYSNANFSNIKSDWFKQTVKKYIQYLCQASQPYAFATIKRHLYTLGIFSRYLNQANVTKFYQINRHLILAYLAQEKNLNVNKLGVLRSFFTI